MIKRLGIVLLAAGMALPAFAQMAPSVQPDSSWKEGKNYCVIEPAQPSSTPGKIEVTEVFSYGVSPADFEATANSFAINTQVKKADAFVRATGVDQTPTVIVAGKYRMTASSAGSNDKLVELVRYLVDKESAGG